jgi:hypothetical protein
MDIDAQAERLADMGDGADLHNITPEERHAFVFVGLPGAGKSVAKEYAEHALKSNYEWAVTEEVSSFVRSEFERETAHSPLNDNALGRWAADMKDEHGNGYFVEEMARDHAAHGHHVCISGVRSPAEAEALDDHLENVTVIGIWTMPHTRFERKYGDPPTAEHPKYDEFIERKERELWDWGCVEFFDRESDSAADYVIPNNAEITEFEDNVRDVVLGVIEDEAKGKEFTHFPFPEGLNQEQIAQYL